MNKNIKKILIQQNLKDFYQNNPKGFYQVTFFKCLSGWFPKYSKRITW
jgi:hypothetical protein